MEKISPMLRQYMKIKEEHSDSILFFRMGDFYEMFFDDAKVASKILDIVLTSRNSGKKGKVPMCGVPHHAAQNYIARLIKAGHNVAICEQVEDPKQARGVVKRQVIRTVTPATFLEPSQLDEKANNYLAVVNFEASSVGMAFVDLSTGEFLTTQKDDCNPVAVVRDELVRVGPVECLLPESSLSQDEAKAWRAELADIRFSPLEDWVFSFPQANEVMTSHYDVQSLAGFGLENLPLAVSAAGAALSYLKDTQSSLEHLRPISTYWITDFMVLDSQTQRNLELVETLRDRNKRGSLLGVLDQTVTAMGGRKLKSWILQPVLKVDVIRRRQDAVAELYSNNRFRQELRGLLSKTCDIERLVARISSGTGNARDMVALRSSLELFPDLKRALARASSGLLEEMHQSFDELADMTDLLQRAIVDDPPVSVTEGNLIRSGYSEDLDRLKGRVQENKRWIANLQKEESERTGIASLKVGFNKVFGYYIEVTKPNLALVPDTYIRKQTLTNAERYVTPELKDREAEIVGAEENMAELEYEIFSEVRAKLCGQVQRVQTDAGIIARLDALLSLAQVAAGKNYVRPTVTDDYSIDIEDGRHPVLEDLTVTDFVPNDVHFDQQQTQMLVVTGPNMAGKSTYLRQVALIVLMAQMGSFVPAEAAEIGVVDRIFTRVGAADNLVGGQSTFMVEMNETANILNNSTSRSLIVLDEIGRGTSTYDGVSIAWSVAQFIHDSIGAKTLFATHYHELTELEKLLLRAKNRNVAVREWNNEVVFLYKIVEGGSDHSHGIHVAKLAGLPGVVIERSKEILDTLEQEHRKSIEVEEHPQLSLFGPPEPPWMEEELKELDLDDLSPRRALDKLFEWKRKLKEKRSDKEPD